MFLLVHLPPPDNEMSSQTNMYHKSSVRTHKQKFNGVSSGSNTPRFVEPVDTAGRPQKSFPMKSPLWKKRVGGRTLHPGMIVDGVNFACNDFSKFIADVTGMKEKEVGSSFI
jgi:hypothetical protein